MIEDRIDEALNGDIASVSDVRSAFLDGEKNE